MANQKGGYGVSAMCVVDYIGPALHVLRVHLRLTQGEVAEELSRVAGCTIQQSYVSKVESGVSNLSLERLAAFCVVFETELSTVMELAERLAKDEIKPKEEIRRQILETVLDQMSPEALKSLSRKLKRENNHPAIGFSR